MDLVLEKALTELKEAIASDPRVKFLSEVEAKLYEDPALLELVKKKNDLEKEYGSLLSYEEREGEKAKQLEHALYEAKLELDNHPLAKEYSEAFIKVRDIYMQIDDIIFGPYRKKTLSTKVK